MTGRDRFLAALSHQEGDRVPFHDHPWASTILRWREEGMPTDISPADYFGFELIRITADTTPRFPTEVLEETEEYVLSRNSFGGVVRNHKDYSTTPEIVDYPCKSRDDWEKIKEKLKPDPARIDWDGKWPAGHRRGDMRGNSPLQKGVADWRAGLPGCRAAHDAGMFTCYLAGVGYDKIQSYVASEQLLMAIVSDPEWVMDMYETDADLVIATYEMMKKGGFQFDAAFLGSDLGYRNGLLFSPHHYDKQLRPTLRRLFDYFRGEGMPVILHCCGNVKELIPRFIEDGLACLQPLEVKAGMDLIELKKQFGDKITFMGGIDVRLMVDPNPKLIEEEIRTKVSFAKKGGGYIYHSDHSIPNTVSFERFCKVRELALKYGSYR